MTWIALTIYGTYTIGIKQTHNYGRKKQIYAMLVINFASNSNSFRITTIFSIELYYRETGKFFEVMEGHEIRFIKGKVLFECLQFRSRSITNNTINHHLF